MMGYKQQVRFLSVAGVTLFLGGSSSSLEVEAAAPWWRRIIPARAGAQQQQQVAPAPVEVVGEEEDALAPAAVAAAAATEHAGQELVEALEPQLEQLKAQAEALREMCQQQGVAAASDSCAFLGRGIPRTLEEWMDLNAYLEEHTRGFASEEEAMRAAEEEDAQKLTRKEAELAGLKRALEELEDMKANATRTPSTSAGPSTPEMNAASAPSSTPEIVNPTPEIANPMETGPQAMIEEVKQELERMLAEALASSEQPEDTIEGSLLSRSRRGGESRQSSSASSSTSTPVVLREYTPEEYAAAAAEEAKYNENLERAEREYAIALQAQEEMNRMLAEQQAKSQSSSASSSTSTPVLREYTEEEDAAAAAEDEAKKYQEDLQRAEREYEIMLQAQQEMDRMLADALASSQQPEDTIEGGMLSRA